MRAPSIEIPRDVAEPRFVAGQVVEHKHHGYRGVIIAVDDHFAGSDAWYARGRTRPRRDQPWYHVLIHDSVQEAYVAERNLELVERPVAVEHPLVPIFFDDLIDGRYVRNRLMN